VSRLQTKKVENILLIKGDEKMTRTTFDLVPLQRFAVGFDQLFNDIDRMYMNSASNNTYPPYNIIKEDDDTFLIEIAVAGFSEEELDISIDQQQLIVTGNALKREDDKNYVHRGIGLRNFTRTFRLADHIEVRGASLNNGLLAIELVRIIPEELKPRKIAIKT
jgi:molecular chaperone IbpA